MDLPGLDPEAGAIENLALWQALVASAADHEVQFTWVRGHNGHPKNEFVDFLAVRAAREQITSDGLVESEFDAGSRRSGHGVDTQIMIHRPRTPSWSGAWRQENDSRSTRGNPMINHFVTRGT
jgi:hypothetical protein